MRLSRHIVAKPKPYYILLLCLFFVSGGYVLWWTFSDATHSLHVEPHKFSSHNTLFYHYESARAAQEMYRYYRKKILDRQQTDKIGSTCI